ncbi:ABC transporter substrate-binding protein [Desulfobacterales bacterium HSG2]|nr:ABC transporter substrate-binding protein [Desulfobacterales bacterium HSG2]
MKNVCVKMMMCLVIVAMCVGQGIAKEPLQPVTIQLNWVTNAEFAGILLAKDRGWYEEAGIDLTVKGWEAGIDPIDEVVTGKALIGVTEGSDIIKARVNEKKIRATAVQFQKSPFCLVSKKSLGIETPEQLTQKKIGTNTAAGILMTKIVLANAGLKYNDITPVRIGWDIQVLFDDKIDVYPGYMNNEPLTMKEKGYETNVIPAFKYGYDFYSEVYFVTDTMIQKRPDLIRKFLDATLRGWKEAFNDLAGTAKLVVEKYYPEGSVRQQTESLKVFKFLARLGEGRKYLGWMEEEYWAKGIDILHKFRQTDRKIPAADVFTLKFLESVYFGKRK